MQPAERCIQTVQEGSKTKWEGSVTILSLVAKFPKKVIPKNTFAGRHSAALPGRYGCAHAWGTGQAEDRCMCAPCFKFVFQVPVFSLGASAKTSSWLSRLIWIEDRFPSKTNFLSYFPIGLEGKIDW